MQVLGSAAAATGAYAFPAGRLDDGVNVVTSALSGEPAPNDDEVSRVTSGAACYLTELFVVRLEPL